MSNEQEYVELVIKDFNKLPPSGNKYDLSDENTLNAIKQFCKRDVVFGEMGNPTFEENVDPTQQIKRCSLVSMDNAVVSIEDIKFDKDKNIILGKVKPYGNVYQGNLINDLINKKAIFGMRSFCRVYEDNRFVINNIVTFDIISPN